MSYKIVVDSCCEIPEYLSNNHNIEIVPLELQVGEERMWDDETFDQKSFLKKVAESVQCPKSSCPSPERYRASYDKDADRVYVITLSSQLSGSYNSAVLGKNLLECEKKVHVFDSWSASGGETQLVLKIIELEEKGKSFQEVVEAVEHYRDHVLTYFVLDNLDTLRKNGRLSGVKSVVASTLNIKPIMQGVKGSIVQKGQSIGIKKSLNKMVEHICREVENAEQKTLIITHCNCRERAEYVKELIIGKIKCKNVFILDTRGVSSMYANDGGVIVTI